MVYEVFFIKHEFQLPFPEKWCGAVRLWKSLLTISAPSSRSLLTPFKFSAIYSFIYSPIALIIFINCSTAIQCNDLHANGEFRNVVDFHTNWFYEGSCEFLEYKKYTKFWSNLIMMTQMIHNFHQKNHSKWKSTSFFTSLQATHWKCLHKLTSNYGRNYVCMKWHENIRILNQELIIFQHFFKIYFMRYLLFSNIFELSISYRKFQIWYKQIFNINLM